MARRNLEIPKRDGDQLRLSVACSTESCDGVAIALILAQGALSSNVLMSAVRARALGEGLIAQADFCEGKPAFDDTLPKWVAKNRELI